MYIIGVGVLVRLVVVAIALRLLELLLPQGVGLLGVYAGEDEVEDFGVPCDGLTLDALFDVL